jgi:archaellum component FlaG (FlaF/FlaG flagellin family)
MAVISLAVTPASVTEDGAANLLYTFSRTGPTTSALSVNFTVGGTASQGIDYTGIDGAITTQTVTFAAGSSTATVTVNPITDTEIEADETVELILADGTGYTIGDLEAATGMILNDDLPNQAPTDLTVSSSSFNENIAAGSIVATLATTDPDKNNTFFYALAGGTGDTDNGAFTITGNQITIKESPDFESKSSYNLRIRSTDQGGLSVERALVLNVNNLNEDAASFAISGTRAVGQKLTAVLATPDPDGNGTFSYTWQASANGTSWSVIGTGTELTIAKAQEGKQIRLLTSYTDGQGLFESVITTADSITAAPLPALSIVAAAADQPEGNAGTTAFIFTVKRTGDTSAESSALWSVMASGSSPVDARDFNANRLPTGTVRFLPGQTSQTISVNVRADLEQEPDESFTLSLSQPTGATISTATAVGTIRNDDLSGTTRADTIRGSNRAEFIDGRAGQDLLTGGPGPDRFGFRTRETPITAPDRITDFGFGDDRITILNANGTTLPLPRSFTRAADSFTATTLSELAAVVFADADGRRNGNQPLPANGAALVRATNRAISGTYLLINDNVGGLNTRNDLLLTITGFRGGLPGFGTIATSSVFS